MKRVLLTLAIIANITAVTAVTATYTGEIEKEGPETDLKIGYASDEEARIELEVAEREGLNITYEKEIYFDPDNASKTVQRRGKSIPLIEKDIRVESKDIVREEYEIPVTLRAFRKNDDIDSTRPEIVQERDFSFRYLTAESPEFGFKGDLIDSKDEENTEEEPDETLNLSKENTITEEKANDTKGSGELESGSGINPILAASVILVFGYTIYEAFT